MKFDLNFVDFLKLPTKIMAALAMSSGLIIFLPDFFVGKMYLSDFRDKYGFIIGLVFLISFSILSVSLVLSIYKYYTGKHARKKFIAEGNKRLRNLDIYKKAIVYYLYSEDNHTGELPLHDGAVNVLEHNLVIGKATTQYFIEDLNNAVFPYMLQPWVIEELQKDSNLEMIFKQAADEQLAKERGNLNNSSKWNDFY